MRTSGSIEAACSYRVGGVHNEVKMGLYYVALFQGSQILAGFHYRNLILGIKCFMLIALNVN